MLILSYQPVKESEMLTMKNRFNAENLPLSFFNDFHDIEVDDVKQAILDIANVMYDDYSIEEVKTMFSTFAATSYEIYELNMYHNDYDDFKVNLDLLVEVILFCASQLEEYKVRPLKRRSRR